MLINQSNTSATNTSELSNLVRENAQRLATVLATIINDNEAEHGQSVISAFKQRDFSYLNTLLTENSVGQDVIDKAVSLATAESIKRLRASLASAKTGNFKKEMSAQTLQRMLFIAYEYEIVDKVKSIVAPSNGPIFGGNSIASKPFMSMTEEDILAIGDEDAMLRYKRSLQSRKSKLIHKDESDADDEAKIAKLDELIAVVNANTSRRSVPVTRVNKKLALGKFVAEMLFAEDLNIDSLKAADAKLMLNGFKEYYEQL